MLTPLLMVGLLVGPWLIGALRPPAAGRDAGERSTQLGCLGITLVFVFTGLGHFLKTEPMSQMLPAWVPGRVGLVYLTGLIEIAAALAVCIPAWRIRTGRALIVMLLLFLPVNIDAAFRHVAMGAHAWGPVYLLIRVPLQALLIGWIWWFAVRQAPATTTAPPPEDG